MECNLMITFTLQALPLLLVLRSDPASSLGVECLQAGANHTRVTVCDCVRSANITCGPGQHIVIDDVHFGTSKGQCNSSTKCNSETVCQYKMNQHCDDSQLLEIPYTCNGQRTCTIHTNSMRTMPCSGTISSVDYTTVAYRCETDISRPRFDICGKDQNTITAGTDAYIISPSFPSLDSSNANRNCCCSITGVEDVYMLHYFKPSRSKAPSILFGKHSSSGLNTADFNQRSVNAYYNAQRQTTYRLTWYQQGKDNSGVFLAWFKGRSGQGTTVTIRCSSSGCPYRPSGTFDLLSTTVPHVHVPATVIPTIAEDEKIGDASKHKNVVVGFSVGLSIAVVLLVSVCVLAIVLLRKLRSGRDRSDVEYTTPVPSGAGTATPSGPHVYSGLYATDNTEYCEVH